MIVNPGSARLTARTVAIDDPGPLETFLAPGVSQAFLRHGDGVIGIGEITRFETDSLDAADIWWADFCETLEHETELMGHFGTGPLAFGSFAFDPDRTSQPSVLVVPQFVIGRRQGVSWFTELAYDRVTGVMPERQGAPLAPGEFRWADGALSGIEWQSMVGQMVDLIKQGRAEKVVLARDLVASAERPIDARWLVERLAAAYPTTWTYLVDGMVGASPEMLVRRQGGLATSRVLAGTIRKSSPEEEGRNLAAALVSSSKDLREHEFAVRSVAEALAPFCSGMNVPEAPFVLELPNLMHLATDVTGVAWPDTSSLALAAALHPSAAVCGTPTHVARDLIAEFEGMDRGRYSGPIGWIDTAGDGEWAIALRGGMIHPATPNEIQVFAGCGIVIDSDPAEELAETGAKLRPMREALG